MPISDQTVGTLNMRLRLEKLELELRWLQDEIAESPDWLESSPRGIIADMDDEVLRLARMVVGRLALDCKYPSVKRKAHYLPVLRRCAGDDDDE